MDLSNSESAIYKLKKEQALQQTRFDDLKTEKAQKEQIKLDLDRHIQERDYTTSLRMQEQEGLKEKLKNLELQSFQNLAEKGMVEKEIQKYEKEISDKETQIQTL